jgi:hypothetical protein
MDQFQAGLSSLSPVQGFGGSQFVWICLKVRRCFRDFVASVTSQVASFSA